MISKKYIFGLHPCFWHRAPKTLEISQMIGDESVFRCVSGMPFGKHLRMGVDCRQSQLRGGSDGKELTCSEGGLALIPGWGRSPEEGNGNPLQYSCLENPIDREAGRATVHGVTKCRRRLSN